MQITEHIHALKIPFLIPVGPGKHFHRFVYVYLLIGPEICLIDSGVKNAETLIFDYLEKLERQPREISLLLLTHAHPDHIGSARAIKAATGCTVAAHPDARSWIEDVEQQYRERPVPGFHELVGANTSVDRDLEDGEVINLGPVSLEVVHTPGHAMGSISFYCKEEGVLFSGDAIPKANDMPIYDDAAATAESITKLKDIKTIKYLLSSWADPLEGSSAYDMMDACLEYLQCIHDAIRNLGTETAMDDPMGLCARMVKVLGLPELAVNPLLARSFISHVKIIDREKLV
jgi:hydroxyacylglutathione hydrolase